MDSTSLAIDKMNFNASEIFKIKVDEKNIKLKISYNEKIILFEAEDEEDNFLRNSFSAFKNLDELKKMNNFFNRLNNLKEVFKIFQVIITNKYLSIEKEENQLKFKIKDFLNDEEFIISLPKKKDLESQMETLIPYVSSLNNKIINLENQINQMKIDFDIKLKDMEKKYIEELNKGEENYLKKNENNGCFSGNGKVKLAS